MAEYIVKETAYPLVTRQEIVGELIRCKDCKYFELDHFEKVEGFPVPIIVAHEICMKWSDGCRTSKDGWCFMGERRTDGSD